MPAADTDRVHSQDFVELAARLHRDGRSAESVVAAVQQFKVTLPSWAFATGGTRFGRFPGAGEPRTLREKMGDASVVHRVTGAAPRISLHIPWDESGNAAEVLADAQRLGLGFDSVNSNTFQDQPGQPLSYKLGSFSNPSAAVRRQAVDHHLRVIEIGEELGSSAITVWLADGSNYPSQMSLRGSFDRVRECLEEGYHAMPDNWRLFTEHKQNSPKTAGNNDRRKHCFCAEAAPAWRSPWTPLLLLAGPIGSTCPAPSELPTPCRSKRTLTSAAGDQMRCARSALPNTPDCGKHR